MKRPDKGDTFTAKVDRISSNGNGVIEFEDGIINIGPVEKSTVGEEVEIEVIAPNYGKCLDESVRKENYTKKINTLKSFSPGSPYDPDKWGIGANNSSSIPETNEPDWIDVGKVISVQVDDTNVAGVPIATYDDKEIHIPGADIGSNVDVKISKVAASFAVGNLVNQTKSQTGELEQSSESDISELRKQAEDESVEQIPSDTQTYSQTAPQYTRSQKVREYVLARADGYCEGCENPAPFINKTDDPYLHAHHIYELSDGGADTPDTVVALCPNCHYRIHHGRDGEDYNQKLLKKVQRIESE